MTMQILAIDVGTGTQDVLLFDSQREPENAFKLVMPAPTVLLADQIRAATRAGQAVLLTGVTMGGGPCGWALADHLKAGYPAYATPDAARTLNDDLNEVAGLGVQLIRPDEAESIADARRLETRDLDYPALRQAFGAFGIDLDAVDVLAVAAFDHGAAPPGVSDRKFRFDYLARHLGQSGGSLADLSFEHSVIPAEMTRLRAIAATTPPDRPLVVMDTAPAAVLGALEDPVVRAAPDALLVNVGNQHTLAFHLQERQIAGLFEHHTGLLTRETLEGLLEELAGGTISNDALFAEHGHGALLLPSQRPGKVQFLSVTGPRRTLLADSHLQPHMAVPYGDMMMAGCWGLVLATAYHLPHVREAVERRLRA
jgi:uncharacterized protein (DUF1786 family)